MDLSIDEKSGTCQETFDIDFKEENADFFFNCRMLAHALGVRWNELFIFSYEKSFSSCQKIVWNSD